MAVALLAGLFFCGNAHAAATTYTVNVTTDTGTGSGTTGDLRYALTQAESAGNGGSTINITATGTILLTSSLPGMSQNTTIVGPGADKLTISGANAYQVFSSGGGMTISISGLTIADGKGASNHPGVIENDDTLTMTDCVFVGNTGANVGAIVNTGTLTISGSTFLNNSSSAGPGGAIDNEGGSLTLYNNTFVGNSAAGHGGAIYFDGGATLTIRQNTFVGNSAAAAGAIEVSGPGMAIANNIFSGNTSTGAILIASSPAEGGNVFFNNSGGDADFALAASDVTGQDPKLLPLGNYGGATLTMLPRPGSPVVCVGAATAVPSGVTTDQRGFALNGANCGNGGVDAGAAQTNYRMVTTTADTDDGSCTTATCSLRDAITAANTAGGDIGFKSSLNGSTITLASALPAISNQVEIVGPGANQLTISGNSSSTVGTIFTVNAAQQASIYGLTITDGNSSGNGGGISNAGTLTVTACALTSNSASYGGGIENSGTVTLTNSTLSTNSALNDGGAIHSTGSLFVTNSTFYNNSGQGLGGGGAVATSGTAMVSNSTFSGNFAQVGSGGGIDNSGGGVAKLNDNIFDGNLSNAGGPAIENGATANANYNVYFNNQSAGSGSDCNNCGSNNNAVTASSEPLAVLGNYGGPTQTMLPLPIATGAICAGSSSLAVDANGNTLTTDQRGVVVGAGGYCASGKVDAGAVQTNYTSAQFTNDTGYSALMSAAVTPTPILSVTENGQNVGGIPVTLTFTGTGAATGLGPVTTVAGTGATFSSITVDTVGASDTLSVSLPAGTSNLSASANLEIDGPVALSPASGALTGGSVGSAYSQALSASGGKSPYTYAVETGTLADGLTLDPSTGVLSGTPTNAGSFSFSIQATDKRSRTASASYTLAVGQASTLITVTSKDTTTTSEPSGASFVGDSVTFTASLTPVGKGVTFAKSVAFSLDGAAVSACSAQAVTVATDGSSATATCVIANLTKGPHTIVATYPTGDANYSSATSGSFTQTVSLVAPKVVVTSSATPSKVDDSVTFTATLTTSGTGVPSSGTVAFTVDGAGISGCGSQPLTAGSGQSTATCGATALTASSTPHSIVATYSGDGTTYDTSASTAFSQTVNKADTAVVVTSSGASGVNQQVTFTAAVTPLGPVALSSSGTVMFKDNGTAISGCSGVAVTVATGKASCSTSFTAASSHTISAIYNGDSNYNATSAGSITTVTQTVAKATTSVAVSSMDNTTGVSGASSSLNDSVTFTATVTPYNGTTALTPPFTGAATLTGTVSFTSNGKSICSASVGIDGTGNYSATCATSTLPAGSNSIVATYSGNSNYSGDSDTLTQTVSQVATTTSVTTSSVGNASTVNQPVTFTASVTPFNAATPLSGSVTFTGLNTTTSASTTLCSAVPVSPSTGVATCLASSLTPGAYTVTASYGSDSNYTASSGSVSQTVGQATTSISLTSSPNASTINQQVTLTAKVTAPAGAKTLNGSVSFTDNGNAIAGCPATTINPNSPTVLCKTSSLPLGANSIVASYGGDANFSDSSSTAVSQTVNAASTSTTITSSTPGNTSTVNQTVSFTATASGAPGAIQFSGAMSFTDNGNPIAGCSALNVGAATGSAVCTTSTLLKGPHTIAASYAGDSNFATSAGSLAQTVNPGASSTTLVSSQDPSIALNPNGYRDVVVLTAAVSPRTGVPLSGKVTFTDNGAPIAECQSAVAVNPSTGTAVCTTTSLGFGSHTILAVYNGDPNFTSSSGSATQQVQDFALTASPTSTVTVSQRFTNTTDPFTSQPITVSATPIAGFTGQLALSCNVVPVSAPQGAVPPVCTLADPTLAITSGAAQPIPVTIDAGSGSTPVATAGTYNVSITGVDSATGLRRVTALFAVNVRFQAPPLTVVSGATTGNASSVQFTLPANVGITTMLCASVTGPTLTSSVAPVALSMGCTFDPSTIAPSSSAQNVMVGVTVTTGATTSARLMDGKTSIVMAGLVGAPILLLLGFMPGGRSSRKLWLRYLGIAFAAALLLGGIGCGGGQFTAPPTTSGQTPPGSYNVLVQGTGTDHQVYQAVIQVNVTR